MLTHEYLKEILNYNKNTGEFTWVVDRTANKTKGLIAGSTTRYGYIRVSINRIAYKAHRLAWFYTYGEWPKEQIDHINGIKTDNRIDNLRDVTHSINQQNKQIHRNGGLIGAHYHKSSNKWVSKINIKSKRINLVSFNTELEAHEAYKAANWLITEVSKL